MGLKNLCRLLLSTKLSNREIGEKCGISHNTVGRYRNLLAHQELAEGSVIRMTDSELDAILNTGRRLRRKRFVEPNWEMLYADLERGRGLTVTLLYEEYMSSAGEAGMSEREFRRRFDRYKRTRGLVMRQPLRPGEQLFVDYSGKRPYVTDAETGEVVAVELWVGVVGSSRKTYAYATRTQQLPDWIDAHSRALEYFGACPLYLVPDNLKSGVVSYSRRDGHYINPTYQEFAEHYDIMVLPARPAKPKDKAAAENGVRVAQRWILAWIRNRVFFSIEELNASIHDLLQALNEKPMRGRDGKSRNELFLELDQPAMKPLPLERYEFAEWKIGLTVPNDYHVQWRGNYYSVPHHLTSSKVDLRAKAHTIDIYHRHHLVASHLRSFGQGEIITNKEHQPPAHRMYGQDQWPDLQAWADGIGADVRAFLDSHFQHHPPVASVQAMKGLRRLARDYGADRLNRACSRANRMHVTTIAAVRSMLARGLEDKPLRADGALQNPIAAHENVRGASSYE